MDNEPGFIQLNNTLVQVPPPPNKILKCIVLGFLRVQLKIFVFTILVVKLLHFKLVLKIRDVLFLLGAHHQLIRLISDLQLTAL